MKLSKFDVLYKFRALAFILTLLIPSTGYAQGRSPSVNCDNSVVVNVSSATTTALITNADTEKRVYICSLAVSIVSNAVTANTIKLQFGTGATCGTGTTDLTGPITGNISTAAALMVNLGTGNLAVKSVAPATNVCIITSQASAVGGVLTYTIF